MLFRRLHGFSDGRHNSEELRLTGYRSGVWRLSGFFETIEKIREEFL